MEFNCPDWTNNQLFAAVVGALIGALVAGLLAWLLWRIQWRDQIRKEAWNRDRDRRWDAADDMKELLGLIFSPYTAETLPGQPEVSKLRGQWEARAMSLDFLYDANIVKRLSAHVTEYLNALDLFAQKKLKEEELDNLRHRKWRSAREELTQFTK